VCTNRFFVHEKVYDAFAEKFAAKVRSLKVGPGTEPGVTQGPMIDQDAAAKVEEHIADATAGGAKVMAGSSSPASAARARSTAATNSSKSGTSAWAASTGSGVPPTNFPASAGTTRTE
jgi:acyl-CoA reductase-like NAD-dependent aldehyde dehydrogenase